MRCWWLVKARVPGTSSSKPALGPLVYFTVVLRPIQPGLRSCQHGDLGNRFCQEQPAFGTVDFRFILPANFETVLQQLQLVQIQQMFQRLLAFAPADWHSFIGRVKAGILGPA